MIRAMIVDDNRMAREYFSQLVDWEEFGYELVCTAIDGESALIQFHRYHPELVITDIQMPNMDGIELAQRIRELSPRTVILFLSSYEEFSYARSAVKLGVSDYILKHETKAPQMIEKLLTVRRLLENKNREQRYVAEGYFQKLLQNSCQNVNFEEKTEIPLSYFQGKYDLTIIFQAHIFSALGERLGRKTAAAEMDEMKKILYEDTAVLALVETMPYTGAIISVHKENPVSGNYRWKELLESCFFGSTFTLLLLCENASIENCINAYFKRSPLFGQVFFISNSMVIQNSFFKQKGSRNAGVSKEQLEKFFSAKEQGEYSLSQILDRAFLKVIHEQDFAGYEELFKICVEILASWDGKVIDDQKGGVFHAYDVLEEKNWIDAASLFCWVKERLFYLSDLLKEKRKRNWPGITYEILLYIYGHYNDSELTAEQIAGEFGVGINQLNVLAKKEFGCTVWKLLIQVRMEVAKRLLDTTNQRIVDISSQVGYSNIAYFSTAFRKYYQVSPQEYRKNQN